jgi:hypothetical protein
LVGFSFGDYGTIQDLAAAARPDQREEKKKLDKAIERYARERRGSS